MDNMELWNNVAKSDIASLKHVAQRGGFTAISAQYQIKKATEIWGSYGSKWGVRDCVYGYHDGEIYLEAVFFYPGGEFQISADMLYKPGNESRKKLLTDLTTKALSKLGFNADVFMDQLKWDGSKYIDPDNAEIVNEIKAFDEDLKTLLRSKGFDTMDKVTALWKSVGRDVEKLKESLK